MPLILKSHNGLRSILVLLAVLLILFTFSCSDSTSPKTGSLSGRVVLVNDTGDLSLDPVDFSGVTIALYELAVLDTTIVRINQEYPHIGVQISQETEFDHRLQNPVAVVISDAEGSYTFNKIPYGDYNLVCYKEGWGYAYTLNVTVDDAPNKEVVAHKEAYLSFRKKIDTILYPERIMPSVIHEELSLETGRVYKFMNDTIVLGSIVMESGTKLLIYPGCDISFHSQVLVSGESNFTRITSSDKMYQSSKTSSISSFGKLSINSSSDVNLSNLLISHCSIGIDIVAQDFHASGVRIRKADASGLFLRAQTSSVENVLVSSCQGYGIYAYNEVIISNSVFLRNSCAIMLAETNGTVVDNYLYSNNIGLLPFYGENIISYNCFDANNFAIAACASDPLIERNSFFDNDHDIELNQYLVSAQASSFCSPDVRNNNFYGDGFFFDLLGHNSVYTYTDGRPRVGVNNNQSYPNNYYRPANLVSHIYDGNHPGSSLTYTVNCLPRANLPFAGAGIR